MRTVNYDIKNAKHNTTFDGFTVQFPFDVSTFVFKLDVLNSQGKIVKTFGLGTGLTLLNNTTLRFDSQVINLQRGTYSYDIANLRVDGSKNRYIAGFWEIEDTITLI